MRGQNCENIMALSENKSKALDAALQQIEKLFGRGSVMKLGQKEVIQVETFSTGSLGLDIELCAYFQ